MSQKALELGGQGPTHACACCPVYQHNQPCCIVTTPYNSLTQHRPTALLVVQARPDEGDVIEVMPAQQLMPSQHTQLAELSERAREAWFQEGHPGTCGRVAECIIFVTWRMHACIMCVCVDVYG